MLFFLYRLQIGQSFLFAVKSMANTRGYGENVAAKKLFGWLFVEREQGKDLNQLNFFCKDIAGIKLAEANLIATFPFVASF